MMRPQIRSDSLQTSIFPSWWLQMVAYSKGLAAFFISFIIT